MIYLQVNITGVTGLEPAIQSMRHSFNSWDKSDSKQMGGLFVIGDEDLKLAQRLSAAGASHAKYLRMINAYMNINAPLYWWKEFDTYKVGTVSNSTSTMHTIAKSPFTVDMFERDMLDKESNATLHILVDRLNTLRERFEKTKDKRYWYQIIQLLPSSYNQFRTVMLNYQTAKTIYHDRRNHKLDEWRVFCKGMESLPHFATMVLGEPIYE